MSPKHASLRHLTRLACRIIGAPIAAVWLLDDRGQFVTSAWGLPEAWAPSREGRLADSLCETVARTSDPLPIEDVSRHAVSGDDIAGSEPAFRAFLGVPVITSERSVLGALCVMDRRPRTWNIEDVEMLNDLSAAVATEAALRRTAAELDGCLRERTEQLRTARIGQLAGMERLQLVLGAARAGIWESDFAAGQLIYSPELYDLFGLERASEPLGRGAFLQDLVHPDDRTQVEPAMRALRERGVDMDIEFRSVRPDGTTIWIHSVGTVERDGNGRPIGAIGIARDVTTRKTGELARREADQFIRHVIAVAPTFIYVFDIQAGRRIYGKRWIADALGYDGESETEARKFVDARLHPEDQERIAAYRRTLLRQPDDVVTEMEERLQHADGSWRWFLSRNMVFKRNADGTVAQIIGAATDITAIKEAQEELRRLNAELEQRVAARTAELTAANRELEAFAYSISHDLRVPVRAIAGFSKALLEDCGERLDATGRHYLERVSAGARRMTEMIDGLLALARATRHELSPDEVDLSVLAHRVTAELQHADPARHPQVTIAPHAQAWGDRRLLRTALQNLLGNAWKFTSQRRDGRIEFGVLDGQGERVFFVRDNGAGFDMANADALFVPFQRLHGAEEYPGTGIGLATVQSVVVRHGGRIWAESAPNEGATFYFTLGSGGGEGAAQG